MTKAKHLYVAYLLATTIAIQIISGCSQQKSEPLPAPKVSAEKPTTQLKIEVDSLIASADDVMIRRNIDDFFTLIDRFVEFNQIDEALYYLSPALKHNSWALDYQLLNARLLKAKGEKQVLNQTTDLIFKYSEKDEQINLARQLLHKASLKKPRPMKPIKSDSITVVLVPIGEPDACVLEDLKQLLADFLGITVLVRDAAVPLPPIKRDPVKIALSELRERILHDMEQDSDIKALLKKNGITSESLKRDSLVMEANRRLVFESGGPSKLDEFDEAMAQHAKAEKQRDVSDILENLSAAIEPFAGSKVYYLGITDVDLFSGESDYVFCSWQNPGQISIVSYRRFTSDFNQETPNRKRLVERTMKASLASIGLMFGVPTCSTPTCPRTYSHSVQELDASSVHLCKECRQGFIGTLGRLPKR